MVKGIGAPGQLHVPVSTLRKEWLRQHGISGRYLAGRFGVKPPRVSAILGTGECPARYIEILRALGMPEDLLPSPSREKPGPPAMLPAQAQPATT
jgi:hypothetical protein